MQDPTEAAAASTGLENAGPLLEKPERLRRQLLAQCEALSPILFAWAQLRLRGFPISGVAPEDVVQEVWLRALANVNADEERIAVPAALKSWLIGIAQNVLFEELRHARRQPHGGAGMLGNSNSAWLAQQADTVTSICSGLARHEAVGRLLEFAAGLENIDRQLLVHCAFEDMTVSDVARRIGVEPDMAIKRWQRLRERLREERLDQRLGMSIS